MIISSLLRSISETYFSKNTLKRLPAFVLYKANFRYRISALTALADLNPVAYGDGWAGLLPDTVEIRPYVDYYNGLADIYRSDSVHISLTHLQMRLYPNQRIFDIGACGRIVLGEKLEGWETLFGNGFNDLTFSDFAEMRQRAELLSKNKGLRKTLGDDLISVVRARHTVSNRIDKMFKVLFNE